MDVPRRMAGRFFDLVQVERRGRGDTWLSLVFHHLTDGDTFRADDPRVRGLDIAAPVEKFAQIIERISRTYRVVDLDEVTSGRCVEKRGRLPVLLCFDDAYASVPRLAAPILAEHSLPWIFFVNPGLVGSAEPALDNRLAYVANTSGPSGLSTAFGTPVASLTDAIATDLPKLDPRRRRRLAERLDEVAGLSPDDLRGLADLYLTESELIALHGSGVEIGNHTRDHVHCRSLSATDVADQILGSADDLRRTLGAPVRAFAYPYGSAHDATPAVRESLRRSGHEYSFLVEGRLNSARTPHDHLYRVSLPGATTTQAELRSQAALRPRLRTLRAKFRALRSSPPG